MASLAIQDAFESAKNNFLLQFPEGTTYDFSNFPTIGHVYQAAEQIQMQQASTRTMRNLRKIQPFLECLRHYGDVIETFIQAKPDILALIWGPIKCILLISSTFAKSFENILDIMAQIGAVLPSFERYVELFPQYKQIHHVLCLLYQDVLDFYATVLRFFKHQKWSVLFESLWPKSAGRIRVIIDNIMKHRMLMDGEVTLAQVSEAIAAREQALAEYEKQHEFRHRQDFEAVMNSLAPPLYDQNLERIKRRRSIDSGGWLQNHQQYLKWLDGSDGSTKLLWLQGIPGAGKTFLSSVIIQGMVSRKIPVGFALLSYREREDASALRLLHSFALQIVLDHQQLQHIIISAYDKEYRQLSSAVEFGKQLLQKILECLPMTFILIDGLDEIAEEERYLLIQVMLELLEETSNLKVLFSSRPEDGIIRLLAAKAHAIRVHDGNTKDIQAYVNSRAHEWLSDICDDLTVSKEIKRLMRKVALNSRGMFLYARLVCDSIVLQGDVHSVRDVVNNLPMGLNEAYSRIISRIEEELDERTRENARTIFSLVTCSIVPLSKKELQLAVLISQGRDPSMGCKGLLLNLLHTCGPIVEDIDGRIQFVHFTAQEYLLGRESNYYLKKAEAHACLSAICVKYLHSSCFDLNLSSNELERKILDGSFILQSYVCEHWVHHLKYSGNFYNSSLIEDVEGLTRTRKNHDFLGDQASIRDLRHFDFVNDPFDRRELANAFVFLRRRRRDLCFSEGELMIKLDPFTFSQTELQVRCSLESMLCDSRSHRQTCSCADLKGLYRDEIYKCGRPGCPFYVIGFKTKVKRDRHMHAHSRPFKCDQENCTFSHLGFRTQILLTTHFNQFHSQKTIRTSGLLWNAREKEELELILVDLVKEDDLQTLQDMWEEAQKFVSKLLLTAVQEQSSDAIIEFLIGHSSSHRVYPGLQKILRAAVDRKNCKVFRHFNVQSLLTSYEGENKMIDIILHAADQRHPDLIEVISQQVPPTLYSEFLGRLIPWRPNRQAEALSLECFQKIKSQKSFLQSSTSTLRDLSARCCSIPLAEILLEVGASLSMTGTSAYTPLYAASAHTTLEAANFMKFLISRGSDTNFNYRGHPLEERPGPKNIKQWYGITWEKFIEDCRLV